MRQKEKNKFHFVLSMPTGTLQLPSDQKVFVDFFEDNLFWWIKLQINLFFFILLGKRICEWLSMRKVGNNFDEHNEKLFLDSLPVNILYILWTCYL